MVGVVRADYVGKAASMGRKVGIHAMSELNRKPEEWAKLAKTAREIDLQEAIADIQTQARELVSIDAVLTRRDALDDCPTRVDKILRCIETAKCTDATGRIVREQAAALAETKQYHAELQELYDATLTALAEARRQWADVCSQLIKMRDDRDRLMKGLVAVESLIAESKGVDGLHLNGDIASWDELRTGGRFEEWLIDFDAALSAHQDTTGEKEVRR